MPCSKRVFCQEDDTQDGAAGRAARGLTLTRDGWTGKRNHRHRNASPGVGGPIVGEQAGGGNGEEESLRHVSPRPHRQSAPDALPSAMQQTSALVGQALRRDSCVGAIHPPPSKDHNCEHLVSGAMKSLLHAEPLLDDKTQQLLEAPKGRGSGCKGLVRATSPERAFAAFAPWGMDSGSGAAPQPEPKLLAEVAQSFVQTCVQRNSAARLSLRNVDMRSGFLGSGVGCGPSGTISSTFASPRTSIVRPDRAANQQRLLRECKDQVANAVAAFMANNHVVAGGQPAQKVVAKPQLAATPAPAAHVGPELHCKQEL